MHDDRISRLDPDRNYGELDYEDVVRDVEAGTLRLEPGARFPGNQGRHTNRVVAGAGIRQGTARRLSGGGGGSRSARASVPPGSVESTL